MLLEVIGLLACCWKSVGPLHVAEVIGRLARRWESVSSQQL